MKFDPKKHHRRSIRLKGYDYSKPGGYFITICTQNRELLFGTVRNGHIILNDAGRMIQQWYFGLEFKFPDIQCDQHIIMPNHFHAIIIIVGADLRVCPKTNTHAKPKQGEHTGSPLPKIVQWFKTMTTNHYIQGVNNNGWMPFDKKLWQRNYWEHIIRDENNLNRIRRYIIENPLKWQDDTYFTEHQ